MQRSSVWVAGAVWLSTLLLIGFGLAASAAQAAPAAPPTYLCGNLGNSTLTLANSPYVVCGTGITVPAGNTVHVDPGVSVQFLPGLGPKLEVHGTLDAFGTPEQPITFTTVVTQQVSGIWWGISADGSITQHASIDMWFVHMEYGGANVFYGAQIYADHADMGVFHSSLSNGLKNGIWHNGGGYLNIQDTAFVNNQTEALHLVQPDSGLLLVGLTATGPGLNAANVVGTTYLHGYQDWWPAGIPYIINGVLGNFAGDTFYIRPGTEMQFTSNGYLNIAGDFHALGLPGQPITITGQTKTPGFWDGLVLYGGTKPASAELDNVTLEYGGRASANVSVDYGYLVVRNSIIRNGSKDGVRINSQGHATILNSQIVGNALYGVRNTQAPRAVLASNDWWGDAAGPTADVSACSPGHGDKVTAAVLFRPFLTSAGATNPLPLTSAPILTLTPRRWQAPADNLTKVYFDITVVDGNGVPLPGRTVKVSTSLGVATDGGITDASGHTLAYLVSPTVGDADVTAALDVTGCEGALSPTARVSFTTPVNITDLFPDSPASYFDGNITVSPEPVVVNVPTLVSAKLTNPLTVPVTVDVSFGFAQAGIGLSFGPIHEFIGQVIPAHGSITLSNSWLPPVSGHYCIQVTYDITSVGAGLALPAAGGGTGLRQHNLTVLQGAPGSSSKNGALDKTKNALDVLSGFFGNAFDTNHLTVQSAIVDKGIAWQLNTAEQINGSLHGDPPRQDYKQLTNPDKLLLSPVAAGGGLSVARANALNALADALAEANVDGAAAQIALDRSGGAAEAAGSGSDPSAQAWQSVQTSAEVGYVKLMGAALITASNRIDDLLNVAAGEGVTQVVISTSDVISFQTHLASGWSAQEISDAHAVGLTDAQLEALRQTYLQAAPATLTGDGLQRLRDLRDQFRVLGAILINPVAFVPQYSVTGSAGLLLPDETAAPASGNTLVQLSSISATVQVGNPVTATSPITVDLRVRRLDLPADWFVSLSPAQVVNLAPGAVTTVTVNVLAGSPLRQGAAPRVAVEGYVGSQLLGGVVVALSAPSYVFFDGHLHVYLPLTRR